MVELLAEKNSNEPNLVTTFIPNVDPLTTLLMLPFMPVILIFQFHMNMMQQLSQGMQPQMQQQRTKVTSITRTGNTLDIIEKWV